ncbi:MAG: hypothetical protein A2049_00565 [Elusimicrobia bacterium GWA2_62_23]|nr:MAG: hypothetical protein A2049_00565 [Elusimicrobia bacterium GWA2_62_23]
MKKILMTAIVTLLIPCAARAAGYGLEADRMEAGRRFDEQQLSGPLAVQVAGEFKRVADAKYNAEARDHSKLEVKAPPVPEAVAAEGGKEGAPAPAPAPAPAAGGAMMSGVSGVKLAVILVMAAIVFLLVLGGGTPLAAISPAATAALFVAGAVAVGALVGYIAEAAAE